MDYELDIRELNKFRDFVYEDAKRHGFYEKNLSILDHKMWILEEIVELAHAVKKNQTLGFMYVGGEDEEFAIRYKLWMKDTLEDELADVLIVTASLAGHYGVDLKGLDQFIGQQLNPKLTSRSLTEFCAICCGLISEGAEDRNRFEAGMIYLIVGLLDYCHEHHLDIAYYLRIKMRYNRMRNYLHQKEDN